MCVGYFDTHADFGRVTELVKHEAGFVGHLTRVTQTCCNWDGRDPIRIMRRSGYDVPDAHTTNR